MKIELDVDIEKFRYSLVGDGYIYDEVVNIPQEKLIHILQKRIHDYIEVEYNSSLKIIRDVIAMRTDN